MASEVAKPGIEHHLSRLEIEASLNTQDRGSLEEWMNEKLSAILEASTVEDINRLANDSGLTASKTLGGRTFEIQDFALMESADAYRENSILKKFVVIRAVDTSTGEELLIDGGGDTFVAQLVAMRDRFGFPFTGTIVAKTTGSGGELITWRMHVPGKR